MASNVVVSALCPSALRGKPSGQEAVDSMIEHWRQQLDFVLPDAPDLIVLPEACDRFPEQSIQERKEYYRFRGDKILNFFSGISKEHNCYIAYSAVRALPDGSFRNSTQLIDRSGKTAFIYNKNHLVISETEQGGILCGKEAVVFEADFGKVAFAICFDLNFHELLEKYAKQRPQLIVFSSMYHGGLMQNYWAYHCQSYFVGAVAGVQSSVVTPVGTLTAHSTNYFPRITASINLDCKVVHLDGNGQKLEALKNKYKRGVDIFDPGLLGSVLVSSNMEGISASDLIEEFEIELWDEYYARSLRHRHDPKNIER